MVDSASCPATGRPSWGSGPQTRPESARVHGGNPGEDAVLRAVVTRPERSFNQDPLLAFRLLADIALRALSLAVNDPATAVEAIDSLEGLLSLLAVRTERAEQLADDAGVVRIALATGTPGRARPGGCPACEITRDG